MTESRQEDSSQEGGWFGEGLDSGQLLSTIHLHEVKGTFSFVILKKKDQDTAHL